MPHVCQLWRQCFSLFSLFFTLSSWSALTGLAHKLFLMVLGPSNSVGIIMPELLIFHVAKWPDNLCIHKHFHCMIAIAHFKSIFAPLKHRKKHHVLHFQASRSHPEAYCDGAEVVIRHMEGNKDKEGEQKSGWKSQKKTAAEDWSHSNEEWKSTAKIKKDHHPCFIHFV